MNKPQQVPYKGKTIFYMDFSNLIKEDEIFAMMNDCKTIIRTRTPKSIYALTNIENMHFNENIKTQFSEFAKGNKDFIKASAVVGVTGLKQIVFNGLMKLTGRDIRSFNEKESALEWLITFN